MPTELSSAIATPVILKGGNYSNSQFAHALLDPTMDIPCGVSGPDGQTPPKRFSVYRNNVVLSLMEALGQAYPSIKSILGEEDFAKIARIYVAQYPPKSAMMQGFGQEFSDFLSGFPPLEKSGFFAGLAKVECDWLIAYHAADEPVLSPEQLGNIAPENLVETSFHVHPAATVHSSIFPVYELFLRRNDDSKDIDLTVGQSLLISRPELDVQVRLIATDQAAFLQNIANGTTLGNAIAMTSENHPQFDAANAIGLLLESGYCSQISENPDNNGMHKQDQDLLS